MTRALCIGLTGGIGSGKTTATDIFSSLGVPNIDADNVSRDIVAPGSKALNEIAQAFGAEVLDAKGELDRQKMRKIVFDDPNARKKLESIIHPGVYARINEFIEVSAFLTVLLAAHF